MMRETTLTHVGAWADESIVFLYNMFYTIFGACTSIIAQDDTGEIIHARNLDFGLW